MGVVRVISDLHLGHVACATRFRGFNSVEEHDNHIINQWNSVVGKRDVVWILGDITMNTPKHYHLLDELKGMKKVILGNHDSIKHVKHLLKHVNGVSGCVEKYGYILTHIPIHPGQLFRFKGNIHGHVHGNTLEDPKYINVSAEVLDFKPVEIKEIISK